MRSLRQTLVLGAAGGLLCGLAGCPAPPASGSAGAVETVAGTGVAGFSGDGGPARAAQLNNPSDVFVRPDGQVVIIDTGSNRVRVIDPATGVISTLAGDGVNTLSMPTGAAFDADGTLYVASWGDHSVYRFAASAAAERIAGVGASGCAANSPEGLASEIPLSLPRSVAISGTDLLIAEQGCHRVRSVSLLDGALRAFAGTGEPGYSGDGGQAVNARFAAAIGDPPTPSFGFGLSPESPPDELYIADSANHVIREVDLFTGRIETFAGAGVAGFVDGPPDEARFNQPAGVTTSSDHAVWVADTGNHAIRRIDPLGVTVTTVIGTGVAGFNGHGLPARQTQLNRPTGVFVTDTGDVYVADTGNHCIRRFRFTEGG